MWVRRNRKRRLFALNALLIASLLVGLLAPGVGTANGNASAAAAVAARAVPADLAGHWAEKTIAEWIGKGWIEGYEDGSFRPDRTIERIEFVTLINRLFAFAGGGGGGAAFKDVPPEAWFASQAAAAVQAGYVQGYPDGAFRPHASLSRVDASVMAGKLAPLIVPGDNDPLLAYKDQRDVPDYGRASLSGAMEAGYMKGYPDGTIRSAQPLTRAEAVVLLDRIVKQSAASAGGGIVPAAKRLAAAGVYGPATGTFTVAGDLTVGAPGIVLRNLIVKGNLKIDEKVGDGDVYLNRVTVLGRTVVNGGGENSIHIDDSELGTVVVSRKDGKIRVVVGGTTAIGRMDVQSDARIEADGAEGGGIEGVFISDAGEVTLSGRFAKVEIADDVKITVSSGTIGQLVVNESVTSSTITLEQGVAVASMELHGSSDVKGAGTIASAIVDAPNVAFETAPGHVVTTDRGGAAPTPSSTPASGGGSGGGGASTSVTVTVSQPSASGFLVGFGAAVANLKAADIALRDSASRAVPIASASTLNEGRTYRIAAALTEGETYSLTLAKAGYSFGPAEVFSVPVTPPAAIEVAKTVRNASVTGFRVEFDQAVPGLLKSDFTLQRGDTGTAVEIAEAASNADGTAYELTAALEEGVAYTLSVAKTGYRFGGGTTIYVPVTDPEIVSVAAAVYGIGQDGFRVSFSEPVTGLTADSFVLTDGGGEAVAIGGADSEDGGASYAVAAALTEGGSYTLAIAKSGYSFGAALAIDVPGAPDEIVTPTVANVRTYGFVLSLDKPVPGLDGLDFVLKNGADENVSIDMISAADAGRQYEIWSTLDKEDEYTLALDKDGYAFAEPAVLKVEPEKLISSVGWVSHGSFRIDFPNAAYGLSAAGFSLKDASGNPVAIDAVEFGEDGKSAVVSADLSAAGVYQYRIDADEDRYAEGAVHVPETIAASKYTVFDGYPGDYQGLVVQFANPVPGLTAEAFSLTNGSGAAVAVDSAASSDGGSSYSLRTAQLNSGGPFTLAVAAAGYEFGAPAKLINATLNVWNAGRLPSQFMAGLNPSVPDLTADNFSVKDAAGNDVAVTNVAWDGSQHLYIVTFAGTGGQNYTVTALADGYDFGKPKPIRVYSQSEIADVTYAGLTLALVPPAVINTEHGFKLTTMDGAPVAIQSVVMEDGGALYRVAAKLTPGYYVLSVDADLDQNAFTVYVPVVATLSVGDIANDGLTAKLDYAVDSLDASSFTLVHAATGEPVAVQSAVTADQGLTYRLSASLSGGRYNLRLNGHLPAAGVDFEADATNEAGATTISNVTTSGFDLAFERPVAGLLPANLDIRDGQGSRIGGASLSTDDKGATYHVRAALASDADYTLTLTKAYVVFDSPKAFHVNRSVTAGVADVTGDGRFTLRFSPAFPEILNGLGLILTDAEGNRYYPNYFETADDGASYQVHVPSQLRTGTAYTLSFDKSGFSVPAVTFSTPPAVAVTGATTAGLQVLLEAPIPGLAKKNFIVKSAAGETIALTSATTDDGGAHYTIAAKLPGGTSYTVQYKPDVAYQVNEPVAFSVSQTISASVGGVTDAGFKLLFSVPVPGLAPAQVDLRDPNGDAIDSNGFTLKTTDQGLSYQFAGTLAPGGGYTLDLVRGDFKLAAPISFDVPTTASVSLIGTAANRIVVAVYPELAALSADNFVLLDGKGRRVAITAAYQGQGSSLYNLDGEFDPTQVYTLQTTYPGYAFGAPISIGFRVSVDPYLYAATQKGFKIRMTPAYKGLAAADLTVTDESGQAATVQALKESNSGADYEVLVPLSGGKTYTATFANKPPYTFKQPQPFRLNVRAATVDRLSLRGFWLNLTAPLSINYDELSLVDDQGKPVAIQTFVSPDAGLTYEIGAVLEADKTYSLSFRKLGYDFGADLPVRIQSVAPTFEGMESGNNNAFTLRFDRAVPNMRPSDFRIFHGGSLVAVPAANATTTDGGYTYKVESNFWGAEAFTVLPVKDGYDFGSPIAIDVPILVSSDVVHVGVSYVDIGLNPAVPGLAAGSFTLKAKNGQPLAATSAVSTDGGATYRIQAAFAGGQTYAIGASKEGYDFWSKTEAELPDAIEAAVRSASPSEIVVRLSPSLGGLTAGNFTVRDSAGRPTALESVAEGNGGAVYTLAASFTEGASYTVSLAAPGYGFGSALTAAVPIPVGLSYEDIRSDGLTVKLTERVPGLTAGSFMLSDAEGQSVPIASATAADGGASYRVSAALQYGKLYSLSAARSGYDFAAAMPFAVLKPVSAAVTSLSKSGLTISLEPAVPNLTPANLSLLDGDGATIPVQAWTTSDEGRTYTALVGLAEGVDYSLSVAAAGYDFGARLPFNVQTSSAMTATGISADGFTLNLSVPIPQLNPKYVRLADDSGQLIALSAVNFYDPDGGGESAGRSYKVQVPIAANRVYTLIVLDPAHPAGEVLEIMLSTVVGMQVAGADGSGITVTLDRSVDLSASDVVLLNSDGEAVAVSGVEAASAAGSYRLSAALAEGSAYTLRLKKKGYDFGAAASVYVAYRVVAKLASVNENGFVVSLSAPVAGATLTLTRNGDPVAIGASSSPDYWQTYRVAANVGYNEDLKLKLSKPGYDFGDELTVNNVSAPPILIAAASSESGTQVVLTFDKPLAVVPASAGFSLKIDSAWQSSVSSTLGTDPTQVVLTWSAGGRVIQASSTAVAAFTGVNRVKATNQTYLAPFGETSVANVATPQGLASSYFHTSDAAYPASVLHMQYGKTALQTAELLRDAGFATANLYRTVAIEYQLDDAAFASLLYAMQADPLTLAEAYASVRGSFNAEYPLRAGFTALEVGPAMKRFGYQGKDVFYSYYKELIDAASMAQLMKTYLDEPASRAVSYMNGLAYDKRDIAVAVQSAYGLSGDQTIQALVGGRYPASDAAYYAKELYRADAATTAAWLLKAGVAPAAAGAAIKTTFGFENAAAAAATFLSAGMSAADVYGMLRGSYSPADVAIALLDANNAYPTVASIVQAAGDGPMVMASALSSRGYDIRTIAGVLNDVWIRSGTPLANVIAQFRSNGYDLKSSAAILREGFGADIATAYGALYPTMDYTERLTYLKPFLDGGYAPIDLAAYFMNNRPGGRDEVFYQLQLAGATAANALQTVSDAVASGGSKLTVSDAVKLYADTSLIRYEARDIVAALQTVFAQDASGDFTIASVAGALSRERLWDKNEIARALIVGMGMTLQQWVELERTDAFARFGCPCSVDATVRESQLLFANATLPNITVAMSLSDLYTLDMIVEGTINRYPGSNREGNMPYLLASLKNAGYPFDTVAAEFESKGWTEWVAAFSKYGIAAIDAAAYLKGAGDSMERTIDRLSPYPLKDRALVLRELYGQSALEATTLLNDRTDEDGEDISRAVAWAYGGDAIKLWIQTLRAQGATASSVINTLSARYPAYWDTDQVGPALVNGGYSMDEVIEALIRHAEVRNNLQATIALLQGMYGQEQVTVARLLSASSSDTPAAGIAFLRRGGYTFQTVARALKSYYGLTSGEAAVLLTDAYPYNQSEVLTQLTSIYGQGLEASLADAIDAEGIGTVDAAIEYLRYAGFGLKEIAGLVKSRFGLSSGDAAALFLQKNMAANENVIATTVASVYGESVDRALYGMLVQRGLSSYDKAIEVIRNWQFNLTTSVQVAKNGYGLSAGAALAAQLDVRLYSREDIQYSVSVAYGTTQSENVADSLTAGHLDTLGSAVLYLLNLSYSLNDIVRIGKEHYGLTAGDTAAALIADRTFYEGDIESAVAYVYDQTPAQTTLDTLAALGASKFADAIPGLVAKSFSLGEIVLAGKSYYQQSAAETIRALAESERYRTSLADVLAAVAQYYGKPIDVSLESLLNQSGIDKFADAVPYLRLMGYTLQDAVGVAKNYYGYTSAQTLETLNGLGLAEGDDAIEWTVQQAYGDDSQAGSAAQSVLNEAGVTDEGEAVAYLWKNGYSLADIANLLKLRYGETASGAARRLLGGGSYDAVSILSGIGGAYGAEYDADLIKVFLAAGVFASETDAVNAMISGGYRMAAIAQMLKRSYAKSSADAKAILLAAGVYAEAAVQSTVAQVYGSADTPSATLQDVLALYGIATADAAAAFLARQGASAADILQYLKDIQKLEAGEASELLAPYYSGADLGMAVLEVYYSGASVGYLAKLLPASSLTNPSNLARYMKGQFKLADTVLALKVIFNLDPLGVTDAIPSDVATAEQVRSAVTAVFGDDPLFAYLKRMKDKGTDAMGIATELQRRGVLDTSPSAYLVDTLATLGYDAPSVVKTRFYFYSTSRQNAGTAEEIAADLAKLGVNTPASIMLYAGGQNLTVVEMIDIMRIAAPNAAATDMAFALRGRYVASDVLGALDHIGATGDDIAAILKQLGATVAQANGFLHERSPDDMLRWLIRNGYSPGEYIRYANVDSVNSQAAAVMKEFGISANDIANTLSQYLNKDFYSIAKLLYDGGFATVKDVAGALLSTKCYPRWVPYYLNGIGGWTLTDVAQGMLDSDLINLVDLVGAIQYADSNNLPQTYGIIKAVSKKEQQAFYDELSAAERYLLSNDDIAMIVAISALRNANIGIGDATSVLARVEGIGYENAIKILLLSGFSMGDVVSAVWDVYRDAIGATIILTMLKKAAGDYISDFSRYYKLVSLISKFIYKQYS